MRRRDVSPEELARIIRLRQGDTSWLQIQRDTGVSRRIAKRAYEKWGRSQASEELKIARKEVAAEEFHYHIEDLAKIAMFFAIKSSVGTSPPMTNAERFFSELWQQDPLQRFSRIDIEPKQMSHPPRWNISMNSQFSIRENELLFQSLQDHIRGEDGRWNALEQWKEARDNSAKVWDKLEEETPVMVNKSLKLERETDLLQRITDGSGEGDPVKQMTEAVLNSIWRDILEDKLGQNLVENVLASDSPQSMVKIKSETFFLFNNDTTRAQRVTDICNSVIGKLENEEKSDMVKSLQTGVRIMKKASGEISEMLNPIKLIPLILRTRCPLCPV